MFYFHELMKEAQIERIMIARRSEETQVEKPAITDKCNKYM